jgi:tellurite resistance protein
MNTEKETRIDLLARVARSRFAASEEPERSVSVLSIAAASYGSRPSGDATVPTGFDPVAVALFEALIEGAYLVANADGVFDAEERRAFERVVLAACGGTVPPQHIAALVSDLSDQLKEDGLDARIQSIAKTITKKDHAREILRIAALLAQTSDEVSPVERDVLTKLVLGCGLDLSEIDVALADVRTALAAARFG